MPLDNTPVPPVVASPYERALDRAIRLLERNWCQGASRSYPMRGQPAYCLLGALNQANRDLGLAHDADHVDGLLRRVRDTLPPGGPINRLIGWFNPRAAMVMRIASWNDNLRRTQDEVLTVMRRAKENSHAV